MSPERISEASTLEFTPNIFQCVLQYKKRKPDIEEVYQVTHWIQFSLSLTTILAGLAVLAYVYRGTRDKRLQVQLIGLTLLT
jgi:hypothetical protein